MLGWHIERAITSQRNALLYYKGFDCHYEVTNAFYPNQRKEGIKCMIKERRDNT